MLKDIQLNQQAIHFQCKAEVCLIYESKDYLMMIYSIQKTSKIQ